MSAQKSAKSALGERLVRALRTRKISRRAASDAVGASNSYVQLLITRPVQEPDEERLDRLCRVLNVAPIWLRDGVGSWEPYPGMVATGDPLCDMPAAMLRDDDTDHPDSAVRGPELGPAWSAFPRLRVACSLGRGVYSPAVWEALSHDDDPAHTDRTVEDWIDAAEALQSLADRLRDR